MCRDSALFRAIERDFIQKLPGLAPQNVSELVQTTKAFLKQLLNPKDIKLTELDVCQTSKKILLTF